jgi:hypothetical protein
VEKLRGQQFSRRGGLIGGSGGETRERRSWRGRFGPDRGERSGDEVPAAACDAAGKQLRVPARASDAAATVSSKQLGGARLQTDFRNNYETASEFKFQITFKFAIKVENM